MEPDSSLGMTMWGWRSHLQLAFEFRQEPPIRTVGDDFLRVRLDQSGFVQAQGIEPERVLGVVVPPPVVWDIAEHLERIVIALGCAMFDSCLRGAPRFGGAEIGRFEDSAQHALGG